MADGNPDDFDGNLLREPAIGPLSAVDRTHAAGADSLCEAKRAGNTHCRHRGAGRQCPPTVATAGSMKLSACASAASSNSISPRRFGPLPQRASSAVAREVSSRSTMASKIASTSVQNVRSPVMIRRASGAARHAKTASDA